MIASAGLAAHPSVHTGSNQLRFERKIQQKMIDPEPGVLFPMLAKVIPECVDPLVRETCAHGICPALGEQPLETLAGGRLQQGVFEPRAWVVDVKVGRYYIVITAQHHRLTAFAQGTRMADQPL